LLAYPSFLIYTTAYNMAEHDISSLIVGKIQLLMQAILL